MTKPDLTLFEVAAPTATAQAAEILSADARRTARQRADVERGWHPLVGGVILIDGRTCGDCKHRVLIGHHNRVYPKCDRTTITHGAGSDCRAWWPACTMHESVT